MTARTPVLGSLPGRAAPPDRRSTRSAGGGRVAPSPLGAAPTRTCSGEAGPSPALSRSRGSRRHRRGESECPTGASGSSSPVEECGTEPECRVSPVVRATRHEPLREAPMSPHHRPSGAAARRRHPARRRSARRRPGASTRSPSRRPSRARRRRRASRRRRRRPRPAPVRRPSRRPRPPTAPSPSPTARPRRPAATPSTSPTRSASATPTAQRGQRRARRRPRRRPGSRDAAAAAVPQAAYAADFVARTLAAGDDHYVYPDGRSSTAATPSTRSSPSTRPAPGRTQADASLRLPRGQRRRLHRLPTPTRRTPDPPPRRSSAVVVARGRPDARSAGSTSSPSSRRLEGAVSRAASPTCRSTRPTGDFSNTIGQSLAVIALVRAGESRVAPRRSTSSSPSSAPTAGSAATSTADARASSDPDATAFAAQALIAAGLGPRRRGEALDALASAARRSDGAARQCRRHVANANTHRRRRAGLRGRRARRRAGRRPGVPRDPAVRLHVARRPCVVASRSPPSTRSDDRDRPTATCAPPRRPRSAWRGSPC